MVPKPRKFHIPCKADDTPGKGVLLYLGGHVPLAADRYLIPVVGDRFVPNLGNSHPVSVQHNNYGVYGVVCRYLTGGPNSDPDRAP